MIPDDDAPDAADLAALDTEMRVPRTTRSSRSLSDVLIEAAPFGFRDLSDLVFQALLLQRQALQVRHDQWTTQAPATEVSWPAVCSSLTCRSSHQARWVFDRSDVIIRLSLSPGGLVSASFAAADAHQIRDAEADLRALLPSDDADDYDPPAETVPITFWCWGGVDTATRRRLLVPSWGEIETNYPDDTHAALAPLFEDFRPERDGQLVLWHGPPGTGKTHAIRALAHAWRGWCDTHYVTDPDVFFGRPAAYMRDVLLNNDDYGFEQHSSSRDVSPSRRWRLLVLEDAGEFLSLDARADVGQGLSRLLNVVDGLLGQGLRLLVIITTNEPVARLHPAVTRPGRSAAITEFALFPADEANRWLGEHPTAATVDAPASLAELYSISRGRQQQSTSVRQFGFR